ncbi:hypothetical protein V8C86DRAFT_1378183 [Haematococcus lacustris]
MHSISHSQLGAPLPVLHAMWTKAAAVISVLSFLAHRALCRQQPQRILTLGSEQSEVLQGRQTYHDVFATLLNKGASAVIRGQRNDDQCSERCAEPSTAEHAQHGPTLNVYNPSIALFFTAALGSLAACMAGCWLLYKALTHCWGLLTSAPAAKTASTLHRPSPALRQPLLDPSQHEIDCTLTQPSHQPLAPALASSPEHPHQLLSSDQQHSDSKAIIHGVWELR